MNRRERILTTLNHIEPDRVPVGFDMHPDIEGRLCAYYGAADLEGVYQKTGIEFFSVWNPAWSALPVYRGEPRRITWHAQVVRVPASGAKSPSIFIPWR